MNRRRTAAPPAVERRHPRQLNGARHPPPVAPVRRITPELARSIAEHSMSHMQIVEGPDKRIVVRPRQGSGVWVDLKAAFLRQYGAAKTVETNPRGPPARYSFWQFLRDLGRARHEK